MTYEEHLFPVFGFLTDHLAVTGEIKMAGQIGLLGLSFWSPGLEPGYTALWPH